MRRLEKDDFESCFDVLATEMWRSVDLGVASRHSRGWCSAALLLSGSGCSCLLMQMM
jgi:hypothetical protein